VGVRRNYFATSGNTLDVVAGRRCGWVGGSHFPSKIQPPRGASAAGRDAVRNVDARKLTGRAGRSFLGRDEWTRSAVVSRRARRLCGPCRVRRGLARKPRLRSAPAGDPGKTGERCPNYTFRGSGARPHTTADAHHATNVTRCPQQIQPRPDTYSTRPASAPMAQAAGRNTTETPASIIPR
jgi:hypothetical protein